VRGSSYSIGETPILLKISLDNRGYPRTYLYANHKRANFKVHKLVALTFVPNPDGLPQVNHKTALKTNNCVENLEWTTRQGNMRHAWDNGLTGGRLFRKHGEAHFWSRLTEDNVREIRRRAMGGELQETCNFKEK
jgi:hypothetical protein